LWPDAYLRSIEDLIHNKPILDLLGEIFIFIKYILTQMGLSMEKYIQKKKELFFNVFIEYF